MNIYTVLFFVACFIVYQIVYLNDNYLSYDNKIFQLHSNNIIILNSNMYENNHSMKLRISDPRIMAAVIFKKNNYQCTGLLGERHIEIFKYDLAEHIINFRKNSTCFLNGGLEPEYVVVIPYNNKLNSYWASISYIPTNNTSYIFDFFNNI